MPLFQLEKQVKRTAKPEREKEREKKKKLPLKQKLPLYATAPKRVV